MIVPSWQSIGRSDETTQWLPEQATRSLHHIRHCLWIRPRLIELTLHSCVMCRCAAYACELTDFKAFQELGWFETQIISLSLHEVVYLIWFEFCGMQHAETPPRPGYNLWNVPQLKFPKIHLFKFLYSAFHTVHFSWDLCCVRHSYATQRHIQYLTLCVEGRFCSATLWPAICHGCCC